MGFENNFSYFRAKPDFTCVLCFWFARSTFLIPHPREAELLILERITAASKSDERKWRCSPQLAWAGVTLQSWAEQSAARSSQLKALFSRGATFCCPSKSRFVDLWEAAPGALIQLAGERIYCQQDRAGKRWVRSWSVMRSVLVVGRLVRVMDSGWLMLWPCHWDIEWLTWTQML